VGEGVDNPKGNNVVEVSEVEWERVRSTVGGRRGDADFMQDNKVP